MGTSDPEVETNLYSSKAITAALGHQSLSPDHRRHYTPHDNRHRQDDNVDGLSVDTETADTHNELDNNTSGVSVELERADPHQKPDDNTDAESVDLERTVTHHHEPDNTDAESVDLERTVTHYHEPDDTDAVSVDLERTVTHYHEPDDNTDAVRVDLERTVTHDEPYDTQTWWPLISRDDATLIIIHDSSVFIPDVATAECDDGYKDGDCSSSGRFRLEMNCQLRGYRGHAFWTESIQGDCYRYAFWRILSAQHHGIVMETNHDNISHPTYLQAYEGSYDDMTQLGQYALHSAVQWENLLLQSLHLYTSNEVIVKFFTWYTTLQTVQPGFSLRFESYRLTDLPVEANYDVIKVNDELYRRVKYDCAPPRIVPTLWRCDMVQQCVGGEDEPSNCSYRRPGCEQGWLPMDDRCLKVIGFTNFLYTPQEMCKLNHDATLVTLTKQTERDFVANIAWRSGMLVSSKIAISLQKVRPVSDKLTHLYRFLWQWGDNGPIAYREVSFQHQQINRYYSGDCGVLSTRGNKSFLSTINCRAEHSKVEDYKTFHTFACTKESSFSKKSNIVGVHLRSPQYKVGMLQTKTCSDGSVVFQFHPCQQENLLQADWSLRNLPMFSCRHGSSVHYSMVCDGVADCMDGSDEEKCTDAKLSSISDDIHVCWNNQIIPKSTQCDGHPDCFDNSDERGCMNCTEGFMTMFNLGCVPALYGDYTLQINKREKFDLPPPAHLNQDGYGMAYLISMNTTETCSETHFQCPNGYCIPTYLLNNGEKDCHGGEDENIPKDNFTCPGYYRCLGTGSCVHSHYVCDGISHCPNKDDERYCNLPCPSECQCEGHAFTCRQMFDPRQYFEVRYLDLSGGRQPTLSDVNVLPLLIFLNVSRCNMDNVSLSDMPLLSVLDLSFNKLTGLASVQLMELDRLTYLDMSGNHLTSTLGQDFIHFIQTAGITSLKTLILMKTGLVTIASNSLKLLHSLTTLDLRGNYLHSFANDLFSGMKSLRVVRADEPRLCCEIFHRDIDLTVCQAPEDELSSCNDLLKSDFFRVFLWGLSVMTVVGNAGVLTFRLCVEKGGTSRAYRVLVVNLCLSDLLMGVYLAIVGVADVQFRGEYVSKGPQWKDSAMCKMAGFLSLVSSEMSALVVCVITLDRFLALRFPFDSRFRLKRVSAVLVCGLGWTMVCLLGAIPLWQPSWAFYGQNGMCLSLPITRRPFGGQPYAFGVFIVLNFILFLVIGVGQTLIFYSIRSSARATMRDDRQREITLARRLFLVVFTDFCCWFPIGLMGLLASRDIPISGDVNVWSAIFVLPLNSAFNPFLYTLNTVLERRAQKRERERVDKLMTKLQENLRSWPREKVEKLVQYCHKSILRRTEKVGHASSNCDASPEDP